MSNPSAKNTFFLYIPSPKIDLGSTFETLVRDNGDVTLLLSAKDLQGNTGYSTGSLRSDVLNACIDAQVPLEQEKITFGGKEVIAWRIPTASYNMIVDGALCNYNFLDPIVKEKGIVYFVRALFGMETMSDEDNDRLRKNIGVCDGCKETGVRLHIFNKSNNFLGDFCGNCSSLAQSGIFGNTYAEVKEIGEKK